MSSLRSSSRAIVCLLMVLVLAGCATENKISEDPANSERLKADKAHNSYHVEGSVYQPGQFSLPLGQTLTLSEALKKAGGCIPGNDTDEGAKLTGILVKRLENDTITVYKLDVRHGRPGNDFIIKPGDSISVPEVIF